MELFVPSLGKWFPVEAFAHEEIAEAHAALARRNDPAASLRVTKFVSTGSIP